MKSYAVKRKSLTKPFIDMAGGILSVRSIAPEWEPGAFTAAGIMLTIGACRTRSTSARVFGP